MHPNEVWQVYDYTGERQKTGREVKLRNPKPGEDEYVVATCAWLYRRTEKGIEVLFQKRSPYVDGFPNKWDRSAGGHVNLGEKKIDAVVRETEEEIGAKVAPEKFHLVSMHLSNFSNMFTYVYACDYTGLPDEFHFDDKEVSKVKWVSLPEFDDFLEKNAKEPLREDTEVNILFKRWLAERGNS